MQHSRQTLALASIVILLAGSWARGQRPQAPEDLAGTRLAGLAVGPHRVGFSVRAALDPTRRTSIAERGTKIGIATWYPALPQGDAARVTGLDYRLLEFARPPSDAEKRRYVDGLADTAMGWRHVGIVELTKSQALATFSASGIARRSAPAASGRYPMVLVLGGQYYLSTTAELLASHGYVVVAPFRFSDEPNAIGTDQFTWYLENSVRDGEWAIEQLRAGGVGDPDRLSVIGHGGGGLQALLFAMRNVGVDAVVNIDAGNFSTRTGARAIPFYSPRLLRAPYLYMATAETRAGQDQFADFLAMTFSERVEVVLQDPAVRHHDLSDLGRAVTSPLGLRGPQQRQVEQAYAAVHESIVRFLRSHSTSNGEGRNTFAGWLQDRPATGAFTVAVHPGSTPAPPIAAMLTQVGAGTRAALEDARRRDPDAPLFQPQNLERLISKALATNQPAVAESIADFALTLHAGAPVFQEYRSEALEARGETAKAADAAAACAAAPPGNDWRATAAVSRCRARAERLRTR